VAVSWYYRSKSQGRLLDPRRWMHFTFLRNVRNSQMKALLLRHVRNYSFNDPSSHSRRPASNSNRDV